MFKDDVAKYFTWNNIRKKLLSRKLWVALSGFVSMLMIHFNATPESAESIASLIMSGASLLGYVIGEGLADGNNVSRETSDKKFFDETKIPSNINVNVTLKKE